MALVSFEVADRIGDCFMSLLAQHGIDPPTRSDPESEILSLTHLIEVTKHPNLAVGTERVKTLRCAGGVHDFAAKVLSLGSGEHFQCFLPHLRLIAESKHLAASISQNKKSAYGDDTARKMAELYLAACAFHFSEEVALDHPTKSIGDNPDVMFRPCEPSSSGSKKTWSLAIKTISTSQGQTIFERIKEGAEQIDSSKCVADRGMVVINAKDAIDHDALWNPQAPFNGLAEAQEALRCQLLALAQEAGANRPPSEWDELFGGKVVRPVLFMGQTLVKLPLQVGTEIPTELKMVMEFDAGGTIDSDGREIARRLNHYMQSIVQGIPGSDGVEPR